MKQNGPDVQLKYFNRLPSYYVTKEEAELFGWRKFEEDAKMMLELLKEWKHYNRDRYADQITVEILLDGKTVLLP